MIYFHPHQAVAARRSPAAPACAHPHHLPPQELRFQPGPHHHACPGCGQTVAWKVGRYKSDLATAARFAVINGVGPASLIKNLKEVYDDVELPGSKKA